MSRSLSFLLSIALATVSVLTRKTDGMKKIIEPRFTCRKTRKTEKFREGASKRLIVAYKAIGFLPGTDFCPLLL